MKQARLFILNPRDLTEKDAEACLSGILNRTFDDPLRRGILKKQGGIQSG